MMAMTTSNSMRVKPVREVLVGEVERDIEISLTKKAKVKRTKFVFLPKQSRTSVALFARDYEVLQDYSAQDSKRAGRAFALQITSQKANNASRAVKFFSSPSAESRALDGKNFLSQQGEFTVYLVLIPIELGIATQDRCVV